LITGNPSSPETFDAEKKESKKDGLPGIAMKATDDHISV
jgi:hypothetical protein